MVRPLAAFCLALMLFAGWAEIPAYAAMKGKTGIGMAEWAFRAYNEGWTYSYGGSSAGRVDCSGLIRSYCNGQGGGAKALLNASSVNGSTVRAITARGGNGLKSAIFPILRQDGTSSGAANITTKTVNLW